MNNIKKVAGFIVFVCVLTFIIILFFFPRILIREDAHLKKNLTNEVTDDFRFSDKNEIEALIANYNPNLNLATAQTNRLMAIMNRQMETPLTDLFLNTELQIPIIKMSDTINQSIVLWLQNERKAEVSYQIKSVVKNDPFIICTVGFVQNTQSILLNEVGEITIEYAQLMNSMPKIEKIKVEYLQDSSSNHYYKLEQKPDFNGISTIFQWFGLVEYKHTTPQLFKTVLASNYELQLLTSKAIKDSTTLMNWHKAINGKLNILKLVPCNFKSEPLENNALEITYDLHLLGTNELDDIIHQKSNQKVILGFNINRNQYEILKLIETKLDLNQTLCQN